MKNFIKIIQKKDSELTRFFEKKELKSIENLLDSLAKQHQQIITNLKDVNYLLDLIEMHDIEEDKKIEIVKKVEGRSNWLSKIKNSFEKFHLIHSNKLTANDIDFLQKEMSKLKFEKKQLEKEHNTIHHLIAKAKIYSMDVRNIVCKEITKGHDIAAVGEKLLENFGKELKGEYDYNTGRKKIMKLLEDVFSINKIKARELVELLEKSKVIYYKTDYSNIIEIPNYENFMEFTDLNYTPLFGNWYINA